MISLIRNFIAKIRNEKIVRATINTFMQNTNKTGLTCGVQKQKWCEFLKKKIHRNCYEIATKFAWEMGVISFRWEELKRSPEYLKLK